jgi:light-regulated signal transduction histidine kinase (bacteriophytochrome)
MGYKDFTAKLSSIYQPATEIKIATFNQWLFLNLFWKTERAISTGATPGSFLFIIRSPANANLITLKSIGIIFEYDIIKAHGGEIKVETKEGEGSEFIIQMPV